MDEEDQCECSVAGLVGLCESADVDGDRAVHSSRDKILLEGDEVGGDDSEDEEYSLPPASSPDRPLGGAQTARRTGKKAKKVRIITIAFRPTPRSLILLAAERIRR